MDNQTTVEKDKLREQIRQVIIDPKRLEFGETQVNLRVGGTVDRILSAVEEHYTERFARVVEGERIDPFDFVQPCEPDCTPERHAYHQGQWDMAARITRHYQLQKEQARKEEG